MVKSAAPSSAGASSVQLFTGAPSSSTTQAPHWLVSHPTCVPVRAKVSRKSSATKVAGSTSTFAGLPLSVKTICMKRSEALGSGEKAGMVDRPCGEREIANGERVVEEGAFGHIGDEVFVGDRVEHNFDERALIFNCKDSARQSGKLLRRNDSVSAQH